MKIRTHANRNKDEKEQKMKIVFTGEINYREIETFDSEQYRDILSEVTLYLKTADFRVPDLETSLEDKTKFEPIRELSEFNLSAGKRLFFTRVSRRRSCVRTQSSRQLWSMGGERPDCAFNEAYLFE